MVPMRVPFTIALTVLLLATSCSANPRVSPAGEPAVDTWAQLHASELAWVRSSVLSYEYTFQESCLCPDAIRAPRRVRVRSGEVVSVTVDGVLSDQAGYLIDDLYRQARVALFQNKEIDIAFAPNGVPTFGVIDVEAAAADGGFIFEVSDFAIRTEGAPVDDDYLTALTAWRDARIGTYFFNYSNNCFCFVRELDVTVTDGQITGAFEVAMGTREPTQRHASDVDDLFIKLRDAMVGDAHKINVEYHPTEGRPLSFFIDFDDYIIDEEWGIQVGTFEPGAVG